MRLKEGDNFILDDLTYEVCQRVSSDTFMVKNRRSQEKTERHVDWFTEEFNKAEEVMVMR